MTPPRDHELATSVIRHLGAQPTAAREIVGLGTVNRVFVVKLSTGEQWVVRFCRDTLDTDTYAEESWCLEAARRHGVPVPDVIAVGDLAGMRYIVQSFVEGENADVHRSPELWRTLGRYARIVNDIAVDDSAPDGLFQRFGRDPRASWRAHIDYNLGQLGPDDPLIVLGVYGSPTLDHSLCRRLMTVPGVGPVTAVRFLAALDDAARCPNAHALESYLGLTSGEDSSSQRERRTGITKAGPTELRRVLVQAAWTAFRTQPTADRADGGMGDAGGSSPRQVHRYRGPGAEDGRDSVCALAGRDHLPPGGSDEEHDCLAADALHTFPGDGCPTAAIATAHVRLRQHQAGEDQVPTNATPPTGP